MADDVQAFLEWHNALSSQQKVEWQQFLNTSAPAPTPAPTAGTVRPGQAVRTEVIDGQIVTRLVYDDNGNPAYRSLPNEPQANYSSPGGLPAGYTTESPAERLERERAKESKAADAGRQIAASAAVLREWGLEELIPELDSFIRGGRSWEEFELGFYDKTSAQGKVVDRLYPEWNQRRQAGNPISIGAIVQYRANAKSLMRAAGLPEGFYDGPEDFTRFITNDVSIAELQGRIQDGFVAASSAPAEVRSELSRMFGIGDGGLAAYFLDPGKALPALERSLATAKIGGASQRAGFGDLSVQEGDRLVGLGVSQEQAEAGFGFLAGADEIVNPLVGSNEDAITREEQLSGVFEGNPNAQRRIQRRQKSRVGAFQTGGAFASGDEGFAGLGSAR